MNRTGFLKAVTATLLLAGAGADAETLPEDQGAADAFAAPAKNLSRTNALTRSEAARLMSHPLFERRTGDAGDGDDPDQGTQDPLARSHLLDDVEWRGGNLFERAADGYQDLGRGLSSAVVGEEHADRVHIKFRDGISVNVSFD